eukprot:m.1473066 g.1473066  ORF g.1473066 m.1473066 type:complete len:355 (+) comp25152_c1_seq3:5353-6417(+)
MPIKCQLLMVECLECRAVTNGHTRDAEFGAELVQAHFHVVGDATGAFVEDGVGGTVVEQPRHCQPLRLTQRQLRLPVDVAGRCALHQVFQVDQSEQIRQLLVADGVLLGRRQPRGVRQLVPQVAHHVVRLLRQVKHRAAKSSTARCGLGDGAALDRPQRPQTAEDGRLAAAVGPGKEHVLARRDGKREIGDQAGSHGRFHVDVLERNLWARGDGCGVLVRVLAAAVPQHRHQLGDAAGVALDLQQHLQRADDTVPHRRQLQHRDARQVAHPAQHLCAAADVAGAAGIMACTEWVERRGDDATHMTSAHTDGYETTLPSLHARRKPTTTTLALALGVFHARQSRTCLSARQRRGT